MNDEYDDEEEATFEELVDELTELGQGLKNVSSILDRQVNGVRESSDSLSKLADFDSASLYNTSGRLSESLHEVAELSKRMGWINTWVNKLTLKLQLERMFVWVLYGLTFIFLGLFIGVVIYPVKALPEPFLCMSIDGHTARNNEGREFCYYFLE